MKDKMLEKTTAHWNDAMTHDNDASGDNCFTHGTSTGRVLATTSAIFGALLLLSTCCPEPAHAMSPLPSACPDENATWEDQAERAYSRFEGYALTDKSTNADTINALTSCKDYIRARYDYQIDPECRKPKNRHQSIFRYNAGVDVKVSYSPSADLFSCMAYNTGG